MKNITWEEAIIKRLLSKKGPQKSIRKALAKSKTMPREEKANDKYNNLRSRRQRRS